MRAVEVMSRYLAGHLRGIQAYCECECECEGCFLLLVLYFTLLSNRGLDLLELLCCARLQLAHGQKGAYFRGSDLANVSVKTNLSLGTVLANIDQ